MRKNDQPIGNHLGEDFDKWLVVIPQENADNHETHLWQEWSWDIDTNTNTEIGKFSWEYE